MAPVTAPTTAPAAAFIARWQGVAASELATAQSFVIELCELLGVPRPHATAEQDYMFERPVSFRHGGGSSSAGRIDCYRRGAFVLESKKLSAGTRASAEALPGAAPGQPAAAAATAPAALTPRCCAPAARLKTTPAPCPRPRAGRLLWWWSMWAM